MTSRKRPSATHQAQHSRHGLLRVFAVLVSTAASIACVPQGPPLIRRASAAVQGSEKIEQKVIYGVDSRRDYYDEPNAQVRALADSTVALIYKSSLHANGDRVAITGSSYTEAFNLCPSERFYDQPTAAFCSGFLIAPKLLVTAGHCLRTGKECAATAVAFGFRYNSPIDTPLDIPAQDVYGCKKIIHSQRPSDGADFAIIELDREVVGHQPLAVRQSGSVQVGDELFVIGHPSGLPTKIADRAKVRSIPPARGLFVANLDTYAGNSGSAVFNAKTLEIEGVLVRGEADFMQTAAQCKISNVCVDEGCRGEDVALISQVLGQIPLTPLTQR